MNIINSESEKTYWAKVFVNDKQVHYGDEIILLNGQENVVKVEEAPDEVKELRLGLVSSADQGFITVPPLETRNFVVNGTCSWTVTSTGDTCGAVTLVAYTHEIAQPLELSGKVSNFDARFIYLTDQPIPHPPAMAKAQVNLMYASGLRATSKGQPAVGVKVTFDVPEHESHTEETGPAGKASMVPVIFRTVGVRTICAVAAFPDGDRSIEMWVNVSSPT